MPSSPSSNSERYITVEQQLSDLVIPECQQLNLAALIEYEAQYAKIPGGLESRSACLNNFADEVEQRAYLLFCDGEFVAANNWRAMPATVEKWREAGELLLHGMGEAVDFDLISKLPDLAKDHPESWVPRRRRAPLEQVIQLTLPDMD